MPTGCGRRTFFEKTLVFRCVHQHLLEFLLGHSRHIHIPEQLLQRVQPTPVSTGKRTKSLRLLNWPVVVEEERSRHRFWRGAGDLLDWNARALHGLLAIVADEYNFDAFGQLLWVRPRGFAVRANNNCNRALQAVIPKRDAANPAVRHWSLRAIQDASFEAGGFDSPL